jgi:hypothetical protein
MHAKKLKILSVALKVTLLDHIWDISHFILDQDTCSGWCFCGCGYSLQTTAVIINHIRLRSLNSEHFEMH